MKRSDLIRGAALVAAAAAFSIPVACGQRRGEEDSLPATASPAPAAATEPLHFSAPDPELHGMKFTLRDAKPPVEGAESVPVAPATDLDAKATEQLLSRVPPLEEQAGDRSNFSLRKASAPPPLTGEDVLPAFPPPPSGAAAPEVPTGPVHVLRYMPEGEIPLAPHLSITFDQPMVAVTSQEEAAKVVPVKLTPEPKGQWRWLGTKTLMFDPDPRFPMATEYRVEVPAGTKSAVGTTVDQAVAFTFATPAPTLKGSWPPSWIPQSTTPEIVLAFDQRVDPEAVAAHVSLTGGSVKPALKVVGFDALEADSRAFAEGFEPGYVVALEPVEPLPKNTSFSVVIGRGTPSAEGPRTTKDDQYASFYTYPPFEITQHNCNWDPACPPTSGWYVQFSTSIDPARFDPSAIRVEPPVPGLQINNYGSGLGFYGAMQGRTAYKVTLPGGLVDQFGQTLGSDKTLTFDVGPAQRTMGGPAGEIVVLDPDGKPQFPVWTTNHGSLKVKIARVGPEDWDDWSALLRKYYYDDRRMGPLPGEIVFSGVVDVAAKPDQQVETGIDLAPYLKNGSGQFVLWVEPAVQPRERWNHQELHAWVQVTRIGLSAFVDAEHLVGWASDLGSGDSVTGATLQVLPEGPTGTTGTDGLAKLDLGTSNKGPQILVARKGDDVAILPENVGWWSDTGGWVRTSQLDQLRWYVIDDRGLYRPGEKARIKGFLRLWEAGVGGDVAATTSGPTTIAWTLRSSMGTELGKGQAKVSPLGGFDFEIALPGDAHLGSAQLELVATDASNVGTTVTYHPLEIQEFRRPEFEVSAKAEEGPHLLGTEATVTVDAHYYAGGGLQNADVTWSAWASDASYVPPNQSDYSFGTWSPWWWGGWWYGGPQVQMVPAPQPLQAKTDASGTHTVGIHFESMNPARPMNVHAEATVFDVNRQAWSAGADILVHPASVYVGLKTERTFVDKGQEIPVDLVVVDIDGHPVAGTKVEVELARMEWGYHQGTWQEVAKDRVTCDAVSKADGPTTCTFRPELGGSWRAIAVVDDPDGRRNESELRVWVGGGDVIPSRNVEQERITLVPEKSETTPGETARILVQAPFVPAEGLMSIRRSGIVRTERFRMDSPTTTLEVPIRDEDVPDLTVQVDLVGEAVRVDDKGEKRPDLPKRIAYASGSLTFQIPPTRRKLAVDVKPRDEAVVPGGETTIDLTVHDADGKPVPEAEVVVVVADESVLALTGYKLPDPLEVFYAARGADVRDHHSRAFVQLANPVGLPTAPTVPTGAMGGELRERDGLGMEGFGAGGGGMPMAAPAAPSPVTVSSSEIQLETKAVTRREKAGDALDDVMNGPPMEQARANGQMPSTPIAVRTNFDALALFAPAVRTDASGKAEVPLKVPDSLTRYRIMVVAVAGPKQFGSAEANVTARLPLMLRPSAPRFLNFGDQFELPLVVQNQTDAPMTVDVAVRATNVTLVAKTTDVLPDVPDAAFTTAGKRITVPANDRVEVRFPAATVMAGTARFQAVAATPTAQDAATFDLPVWTPATTEAFATYGEIDDGAIAQPVEAPPGVYPQFGGLEITTSSTQLQALTDAVLYLESYPYDCNEQIASRVLAIASLRDVLTAFEAEGLPPAPELEKQVDDDLARLQRRQNWDGGWAFWRRGDESWPFLTIHVAHSLARAKEKGYSIDSAMWESSRQYLVDIERHIPYWYSDESKRFLRAYALYVREHMGDADPKEAKRLYHETKDLQIDTLAFLLPTLHKGGATTETSEILRYVANHTTETAAGAHFVTSYSDGEQVLLHSDRRADGIILEALIQVDPKNDVILKVVRGLLGHRSKGAWDNTQENAFVLVALDRYFRTYEKVTPDFVARMWLGDGFAGDHAFRGRTTERAHVEVPMGYLTETKGPQPVTIAKDGPGRLYYRIGLRYAPRDLRLDPADYGFAVEREYEAIDDPGDVRRDDDGTWHVKAGARVRVRVTMATPMRRYHVALVDPMPAGFEAVNPELATSGTIPADPAQQQQPYWWWWRTWYEHENLRDERAEAFASLLWEGVHEYTYVARATTPGRYVVPPAKAEEMYTPETFGRSGTARVVVE